MYSLLRNTNPPDFAYAIIGGEAREQDGKIGISIGRSRRQLHLPSSSMPLHVTVKYIGRERRALEKTPFLSGSRCIATGVSSIGGSLSRWICLHDRSDSGSTVQHYCSSLHEESKHSARGYIWMRMAASQWLEITLDHCGGCMHSRVANTSSRDDSLTSTDWRGIFRR